jgi:acetolactate synthase-1/2/3 large subunit
MARGLLGQDHPLQMRHKRGEALKAADLVILAGVPCDFRLDYGRHIPGRATYISANRSKTDLNKNRCPDIGLQGDPGLFLRYLSELTDDEPRWADWQAELTARDDARNAEIDAQAEVPAEPLNPVKLCQAIEGAFNKDTILVADGGDFVGTASYVLSPRGPLTWLDPGPFGTLGVGAGFALGAKLCRPDADVWIIYGDGSVGYSLTEFDTFARHDLPVIAVVGNDAGWSQIAREQIEILKDDVGTVLERTDYHKAAEAYGGKGFLLDDPAETEQILSQAKTLNAKEPVLINAHIGKTDFRKGSISM